MDGKVAASTAAAQPVPAVEAPATQWSLLVAGFAGGAVAATVFGRVLSRPAPAVPGASKFV